MPVEGPFSSLHSRRSATEKLSVKRFIAWATSLDLQGIADQVFIREISWVKEPGFPSHEYILLTFGDISNPNPSHDTTLRLERDTNSWFKIFGSWLGLGSNCRDTVSICGSSVAAQHSGDRTIAHIAVSRTDIDLRHITVLLEVIAKAADEYRVWSYNCWWYAGCLWRNLVRCIGSNHCRFQMLHKESQVGKFEEFLAHSRGSRGADEWDAMAFSHFQTFSHLAALERTSWDNSELEDATKYIEQFFELQLLGKLDGSFSQTEGLQKTLASAPVANAVDAEPDDHLDIIPSPSSPRLPERLDSVSDDEGLEIDSPVQDVTSLPELEALAWSGPVLDGRYRIQNLRSGHLVHAPESMDRTLLRATRKLHPTTIWNVETCGDGGFRFRCHRNSQCLCVHLYPFGACKVSVGDPIVGCNVTRATSQAFDFSIRESNDKGVYSISPVLSTLFWGLSDDEEITEVRLQATANVNRNLWRFLKISDWD
ncbi:hypothetical protein JAAARDRAFT_31156 [Jaapia argillacea MUCL 33604]|uniref:Uncharacterized protein n=1 Tax=Jaapia argillacea MUCL 33604 TaxID=933084 RepID=A0A067Q685_9AGAM|nr:hypothetical protein JAAARDRAFT_31156 [Jaapia argillacea MUCL 33604]